MLDSKLAERVKNFQNCRIDICRKREENSLRLRKLKLFDHIMEKRLHSQKSEAKVKIDPAHLALPPLVMEEFSSLNESDQLVFLIDRLSVELSLASTLELTDCVKFYLVKLKDLTETLELSKEEDLDLDKNFIMILLFLLFETNEVAVQYEISEIFYNLSSNSRNFNEVLLDKTYLSKFIELSYCNTLQIVENILLIFANIMCDFPNKVTYIIQNIPYSYRLKEMLTNDKYDSFPNIRAYILNNIRQINENVQEDRMMIFVDMIPPLVKYFELNYISNESVLYELLLLLNRFSYDDKHLADYIVSNGILKHLMTIMNRKELIRNYLILCIRIFGNLMVASDYIVDYMHTLKVVETFEKILRHYMNSVNQEDKSVLVEVIWAASNLVAGTPKQVDQVVLDSTLPKTIIQINKFKKDLKILKETNMLFYIALNKSNETSAIEIMKLEVIKLFCEAVKNYSDVEMINIALEGILKMIQRSREIFKSHANIKEIMNDHAFARKLEMYYDHKNKKVSSNVQIILNVLNLDASEDVLMREDVY